MALFETIALVLFIGAVAIACLEAVSRLSIRMDRRHFAWEPSKRLELALDADTHPQLESLVRIDINSDGERGGEYPAGTDTYRILVAGGSAAECYFLDQPTAWPALLESRLSSAESLTRLGKNRVHVGSIARSGTHSGEVRLILERILPRYKKLDLVVLMIGAGDVLRWISLAAPESGLAAPEPGDCFDRHPGIRFGLSPRRSGVAEVIRRLRSRFIKRVERRERAGRWMRRARLMRASASDIRHELPDTTSWLAAYERNLNACIDEVRSRSIGLLVVRQPWFEKDSFTEVESRLFWNGGIGDVIRDDITTYYSDAVMFELLRRIDECSARVARDRGVPEMELMSVIEPSPAHYYDHFHHTPAGSQLIAATVAEHILTLAKTNAAAPDPTDFDASRHESTARMAR